MQKTLFIKIGIITVLSCLFAIGLSLLESLVEERKQNSELVIQDLKKQHVKTQTILTPFIISFEKKDLSNLIPLIPSKTEVKQKINVSDKTYKVGIYHAISYSTDIKYKQKYVINDNGLFLNHKNNINKSAINKDTTSSLDHINLMPKPDSLNPLIKKDKSLMKMLLIPVSDLRGLITLPSVKINGKQQVVKYPTYRVIQGVDYLEVNIPRIMLSDSHLQVEIDLPLQGMQRINNIPLGDVFTLSVTSNWQSPRFIGQALPNYKELKKDGFFAKWQNQYLTTQNNHLLYDCIKNSQERCKINPVNLGTSTGKASSYLVNSDNKKESYQSIQLNSYDIKFAEPNDIYLKTYRSMRYALLIIFVSFGSFFLFEIIKSLRIHPIQYVLVGMALFVFYVLLLSLSEQIAFWQAYIIATVSCAGLIGWYAYYVLHSLYRAGLFTLILVIQYVAFYTILTMEEMNLLIGAILCFIIIAVVMFLTRKIDWYEIA